MELPSQAPKRINSVHPTTTLNIFLFDIWMAVYNVPIPWENHILPLIRRFAAKKIP
jgi:hypothetical protein